MSEENQQVSTEIADTGDLQYDTTVDSSDQEAQEPDNQEASAEPDAEQEENGREPFPKKAVRVLNRKNKQIAKLLEQTRSLEAKLAELSGTTKPELKAINPDDYENYGEYIDAQVQSLVDMKIAQTQTDMQKQQLTQQQQALLAQRDEQVIAQAQEVAQVMPEVVPVLQQNTQLLDALPKGIQEIFYSLDNPTMAVYTLARQGELDGLLYANPYVAASKIMKAHEEGLQMLAAKTQTRQSRAPEPIDRARGSGTIKKQLSPNDDVLKSLGLKR